MKKHRYRITVEHLSDREGNDPAQAPLQFETANHDDIFTIIGLLQQRKEFTGTSAQAFGLGLKLFSEVLLENKDAPLFAPFMPHFIAFMKALKKAP